jgi:phenylacetate-CoA ligase
MPEGGLTALETDGALRLRVQTELLNQHLEMLLHRSPYYRQRLPQPLALGTVAALQDLPFTTKDELAAHNAEFLAVPPQAVVDIATTSGTLGEPVAYHLTEADLQRLARNEAGSYRIAGCTEADVFQLLTTLDKRFMAGLAYFLGVRELGATIIRSGPGALELQWESILRFGPTVLIAVPSFVPRLIAHGKEMGIDVNSTSVRRIICIGEPVRHADLSPNHLAQRITAQWDVRLHSTYASTEMATAFTECGHGTGAHVQPDLVILEVIDANGQPVRDGEAGEVVVTPLGVEGMPLLRYRTGDICHLYTAPCACGRTTPRLGPVVGRKQQLLKLKGTSVYPTAIIEELNALPEVRNFVVEALRDEYGLDRVLLRLTLPDPALRQKVSDHLAAKLRVRPDIELMTNDAVNRLKLNENRRKPNIFIDRR